jgi:hypothetical protein
MDSRRRISKNQIGKKKSTQVMKKIIRIISLVVLALVTLVAGACMWDLTGYRYVTVRWNPTPNVTKYRIEYGTSLALDRSKIVTGNSTKIFINRRLTNYVRATSIQEVIGTPSTNLIIKP